jgi:hypothetical protein
LDERGKKGPVMKSMVARLVTIAGIVVAVCAAAQLPVAGEQYPASTPIALAGLAVAAVGLVAWRRAARSEARELRGDPHARNPFELARQVRQPVSRLAADASELDGLQLRQRVDGILDQYVLPFVAARQAVLQQLGMQRGAEWVMGFALGERLLNRTWTAAADGNLDEARRALRQAAAVFETLPEA